MVAVNVNIISIRTPASACILCTVKAIVEKWSRKNGRSKVAYRWHAMPKRLMGFHAHWSYERPEKKQFQVPRMAV